MESSLIGQLIIYMVVLLFAISAHECAHAWMSYKFGDDTARLLGRITLNPLAHTDPLGTLIIPILNFVIANMSGGAGIRLIGWGKPTPVNPLRWRKKDLANVMVSGAGIMANLAIAITTLVIIKVMQYSGGFAAMEQHTPSIVEPFDMLLSYSLFMNVSLAVFNLLPFPPLDGSKIVETLVPGLRSLLTVMEQYGYLILMALIYMGFFRVIFDPIARFLDFLIQL